MGQKRQFMHFLMGNNFKSSFGSQIFKFFNLSMNYIKIIKVTEYSSMQSLSFSNNGDLLCSVGRDERQREIIVVWDLT